MGVQFEFNAPVQAVREDTTASARCVTVLIDRESTPLNIHSPPLSASSHKHSPSTPNTYDAVLLCTGVHTNHLLAPHGAHLPLRPVYGYSVSAHIKEPLNAPRSGLMDEHYKVSITRLGQRVRVAGSAQVGGRPGHMNSAALQTLYKVLHDWYPGSAIMSQGVQEWQGARPMMANRPPVIGPLRANSSLWLNVGHGSSGWALSCGSARLLADQIAGKACGIDARPFVMD
jgi:D-amino-acid dehydrogenase